MMLPDNMVCLKPDPEVPLTPLTREVELALKPLPRRVHFAHEQISREKLAPSAFIFAVLRRPTTLLVCLLLLAMSPLISIDVSTLELQMPAEDAAGDAALATEHVDMPRLVFGVVTTVGSFLITDKIAHHLSLAASPYINTARKAVLAHFVAKAPAAIAKPAVGLRALVKPPTALLAGAGATAAAAARVRMAGGAAAQLAASVPVLMVRWGRAYAVVRPSNLGLRLLAGIQRLLPSVPDFAKVLI